MRSAAIALICALLAASCGPASPGAPSSVPTAAAEPSAAVSPTAPARLTATGASATSTASARRFPCPSQPGTTSSYTLPAVSSSVEVSPRVLTVGCDEAVTVTIRWSPEPQAMSIALRAGQSVQLTRTAPGVFTTTLRSTQILAGWTTRQGNHAFVGDIVADRDTRSFFTIGVRHEGVPDATVARLAPDAQASARVLNIHDPAAGARFDVAKYTKRLYELYGDDFDFVNVVQARATFQNRTHAVVKNDVRGTGIPLVDRSASYGSAGRLLGITEYPVATLFDLGSESFAHETGHQWINGLRQPPLGPNSGGHWPYSSLATGIMGFSIGGGQGGTFSYTIEASGGDRYRLTGKPFGADKFHDMDLYLMGLLSADRVEPAIVFIDQRSTSMTNGAVLQGVRVTAQDVVTGHGPRVPDAGSSKKDFTVATVLVSHDRLLEAHEMAFFEYMAGRAELRQEVLVSEGRALWMQSPWYVATRGLSTMDARMRPKPR